MPTSAALSSHFDTFVLEHVESGRYCKTSEVVKLTNCSIFNKVPTHHMI